jgi:hypothetical protein
LAIRPAQIYLLRSVTLRDQKNEDARRETDYRDRWCATLKKTRTAKRVLNYGPRGKMNKELKINLKILIRMKQVIEPNTRI